jgi:glycosyltransferase involved in cell wall biosynthesis
VALPNSSGLNKTIWMQTVLPRQLARLGADVCHFTNSVAPLAAACPMVVTIHDMTVWLLPRYHPRTRLLTMRAIVPWAARRARAIVADSHNSKRDIVRILGVPESKVHVIYAAPPPEFRPLPRGAHLDAVRHRYRLPERLVLHVGTIEPRKNLVRLLEAFAQLRRRGHTSHTLVLVGPLGWQYEPVFAAVERLGMDGSVRFLGAVPTDDLVALYNLADALAFPSLYEGFGLPVTEAMACGTPVVTSQNSSLGEVAGEAAELVVPTQVESIATGLQRVLHDPQRRVELRARGLVRAADFSWATAARETRRLYAQVVAGHDVAVTAEELPGST